MSQRKVIARAIEDIIQIHKVGEKQEDEIIDKEKLEGVLLTFSKPDTEGAVSDELFSSSPAELDLNHFKYTDNKILLTRIEGEGCEGDVSNFRPPLDMSAENIKKLSGAVSEMELKSWPSDSDITVLRMKKEFRNALLSKVEWEANRSLSDDVSESVSFDWESHSLINLAEVMLKEKDQTEGLTPFTIWSNKSNHLKTALTVPQKNLPISEAKLALNSGLPDGISLKETLLSCLQEEKKSLGKDIWDEKNELSIMLKDSEKEARKYDLNSPVSGNKGDEISKWKQLRFFFKSLMSCGAKKKMFEDNI